MASAQEIFDRIKKAKQEQRTINEACKDALNNSYKYQGIVEEFKILKEKKKQVEDGVKKELSSEFAKLERLKEEIEKDNQLISDTVLSDLIKGKEVEIFDENENQYVPIFSVKFKKAE
ncbi:MAG: hypothetical protein ABH919_01620 [bacterium]